MFADGYYEWRTTEHGKQPYFVYLRGSGNEHRPLGAWRAVFWNGSPFTHSSCRAEDEKRHFDDEEPRIKPMAFAAIFDIWYPGEL